jgi:hypothetical protein
MLVFSNLANFLIEFLLVTTLGSCYQTKLLSGVVVTHTAKVLVLYSVTL